jgi:hypothetical protein
MRDECVHHGPFLTSDAALAGVAAELRVIDHRSGWSRTLAIGELILKHFFNGNIEEWRTHRRDKDASIRRLAQRNDCPLGRSALSEAVAVYVACGELPAEGYRDQLRPSHLAATLKVDRAQRVELLERAIAGRWTVRELRQRVCESRKNGGERRGRPRSSPPCAALTYLKNAALMLARASDLMETGYPVVEADVHRQIQILLTQNEAHLATLRVKLEETPGGLRVALAPSINKIRQDRREARRVAG